MGNRSRGSERLKLLTGTEESSARMFLGTVGTGSRDGERRRLWGMVEDTQRERGGGEKSSDYA